MCYLAMLIYAFIKIQITYIKNTSIIISFLRHSAVGYCMIKSIVHNSSKSVFRTCSNYYSHVNNNLLTIIEIHDFPLLDPPRYNISNYFESPYSINVTIIITNCTRHTRSYIVQPNAPVFGLISWITQKYWSCTGNGTFLYILLKWNETISGQNLLLVT